MNDTNPVRRNAAPCPAAACACGPKRPCGTACTCAGGRTCTCSGTGIGICTGTGA